MFSNGIGDVVNNNDDLHINTGALNYVGPTVTGSSFGAAGATGGKSIRTSNVSNRIVIVGNNLLAGTSYGITPNVAVANGF